MEQLHVVFLSALGFPRGFPGFQWTLETDRIETKRETRRERNYVRPSLRSHTAFLLPHVILSSLEWVINFSQCSRGELHSFFWLKSCKALEEHVGSEILLISLKFKDTFEKYPPRLNLKNPPTIIQPGNYFWKWNMDSLYIWSHSLVTDTIHNLFINHLFRVSIHLILIPTCEANLVIILVIIYHFSCRNEGTEACS